MRVFRVALMAALLCVRLPAPLIPQPNLAKRIELADTIVVARLISGTSLASGSQVSTEMVLHVDRVLKGDVIPGSEIAAHLEGRGYFVAPNVKQSAITEKLYGIWFLNSAAHPYAVVSPEGNYGELHFASAILPEGAPAGNAGDTAAASVANEFVAALRWIAESHGSELRPEAQRTGTAEQRQSAGVCFGQFRSLAEDFRTLNSSTTLAAYQQFATDKSAPLRAIGIQGMITANDPDGNKRAAADWSELTTAADIQPLIASLMTYSNGADAEAVRALGALALRDPAEPGLRESAVYSLRALHTRETLSALVALLDRKEDRVRPYALSGLCLFVRNAPAVTPESVPSMSWLQSRPPTPLLNPETQRYCLLGGIPDGAADLDAYVSFWKSWWSEHQLEIEGR
jgi:hypothetical protein